MNVTYGYSIIDHGGEVLPVHVKFTVHSRDTGETFTFATRFALRKYAVRWVALQVKDLLAWSRLAALDTDGTVFGQFWNDGDYAAECRERMASRVS